MCSCSSFLETSRIPLVFSSRSPRAQLSPLLGLVGLLILFLQCEFFRFLALWLDSVLRGAPEFTSWGSSTSLSSFSSLSSCSASARLGPLALWLHNSPHVTTRSPPNHFSTPSTVYLNTAIAYAYTLNILYYLFV